MRIEILPIVTPDHDRILAGRLEGKRVLARLLERLPPINSATAVVLDFQSVDLATSSFLSEAVISFRDYLRLRRASAYLVVANLKEKVREELEELLLRANDAVLACDLSVSGEVSNALLLGALDPKLKETFELVSKKREAGALELHAEASESDAVGPTAWNNRLSALAARGLLLEIPLGRAKKYRVVLGAV